MTPELVRHFYEMALDLTGRQIEEPALPNGFTLERKVIVSLTMDAWQLGQDELMPYFDAVDGAADVLTLDERAVVKRFLETLVARVSKAPSATAPVEVAR